MASWMPDNPSLDALLDLFRSSNSNGSPKEDDLTSSANRNAEYTKVDFREKLSLLTLLYYVPFKYIIPSEMYLKEHEMRFFYLDWNWIFALLDGSLSLGRNISFDYDLDRALIKEIMDEAVSKSNEIRPGMQGKELPEASELPVQCTGFVLRSPLVRGWRGLEFKGYNGAKELAALKIENIKDDIIIGIYADCLTRLEILEPPEGLHYGFNVDLNNKLTKTMRSLVDGRLFDEEDNYKQIALVERGNRVIDFCQCADRIKKAFPEIKEVKSAHIALQMIQNAYKIEINAQRG